MTARTFSLPEEETIIKTRILTRTSVTSGVPPLKQLTRSFLAFCAELENGSPEAQSEACRRLLKEISSLQFSARKTQAIQDANIRDQQIYVEKKKELNQAIQQVKEDIEDRKVQLQQERINRQHNEEYEMIKKSIMELPSRAETQAEIDAISQEITDIQSQINHNNRVMDLRRKQFALLLHCVDDLKTVITEEPPVVEGADEMDTT